MLTYTILCACTYMYILTSMHVQHSPAKHHPATKTRLFFCFLQQHFFFLSISASEEVINRKEVHGTFVPKKNAAVRWCPVDISGRYQNEDEDVSSDQHTPLWVLCYLQLCRRSAESRESIGLLLFPAANKPKEPEWTRVCWSDSHFHKKEVLTCSETNPDSYFTLQDIDIKVIKVASGRSLVEVYASHIKTLTTVRRLTRLCSEMTSLSGV